MGKLVTPSTQKYLEREKREKVIRTLKDIFMEQLIPQVSKAIKNGINPFAGEDIHRVYVSFKLPWYKVDYKKYLEDDKIRRMVLTDLFKDYGWRITDERFKIISTDIDMMVEFKRWYDKPSRFNKYLNKIYQFFMNRRLFKHKNKKRIRKCFKIYDINGEVLLSHSSVFNSYRNTLERYISNRLEQSERYYSSGDFVKSEEFKEINVDFSNQDISGVDFTGIVMGKNCKFTNTTTHGCNFDKTVFECDMP